jgi:uncharacterized protein DUF5907/collagen triple helix repeat protein
MPALDQLTDQPQTRGTTNVLEGALTFRRSEWWVIVDGSQQLLGPLLGALDAYSPGDRVAVVVSQDGTPFLVWPPTPEGVVFRGYWNWTNSLTSATSGRVGLNTGAWATATELHLAETSGRGRAFDLSKLQAGDEVVLLDESNTNNSGTYTLAGAGTDQGAYWSFPITYVSSSGTVPANNQETSIFFRRGPGGGAGGGGTVDVDATASATTLAPGTAASVAVSEPSPNLFDFAFAIPRGDPGAQGATGPQGATGAQGAKGDTGAQGPQGVKGDTGATGSQGPQGNTGSQGPQGNPGTAGTPGEKWFTGSGAPAGATGIVGDWYLDSATGDYYEKTGASAWTLRGNLKGPQGIQGTQGPQGNTGTQGPPGSIWRSGTGAPAGALGVVGDWYENDATGDIYEKTGASTYTLRDNLTGPQGPQGTPGAGAPDATTTTKGSIQLAGDLTGTAASPQIAAAVITDAEVNAANKDGLTTVPSLRTLGAGAQQACAGNDARLTNARAPTAHATTHQPGGSDAMAVDAAAATGSLRTLGTGAAQAAPGNDARFGTGFVAGTGAPAAGTGVNGAIYLDIASGRMYGPKAAGAWPATPIGILMRDATTYAQESAGN